MNESKGSGQRAQYWRDHITAWKISEESGRSYCKKHNLIYHRFIYWQRKFGGPGTQQGMVPSQSKGFTHVVMEQTGASDGLTLSLPNGLVIGDIRDGNVTVVQKLLAIL